MTFISSMQKLTIYCCHVWYKNNIFFFFFFKKLAHWPFYLWPYKVHHSWLWWIPSKPNPCSCLFSNLVPTFEHFLLYHVIFCLQISFFKAFKSEVFSNLGTIGGNSKFYTSMTGITIAQDHVVVFETDQISSLQIA